MVTAKKVLHGRRTFYYPAPGSLRVVFTRRSRANLRGCALATQHDGLHDMVFPRHQIAERV